MSKKFTNKNYPEIFYEVIGEKWLDENTYVIIFQNMLDVDGDKYHLEVEYHKDENRITYTRVYDHENVNAKYFVSSCFKRDIDEYILRKCGVIDEDMFINTQEVAVRLKLGVSKNASVGDLHEFIETAKSEMAEFAKTLYGKGIKVIEF